MLSGQFLELFEGIKTLLSRITTSVANLTRRVDTAEGQIQHANQDISDLSTYKANRTEIPTKVSQLTNDSGYVTTSYKPWTQTFTGSELPSCNEVLITATCGNSYTWVGVTLKGPISSIYVTLTSASDWAKAYVAAGAIYFSETHGTWANLNVYYR